MKTIGIICAGDSELNPFLKRLAVVGKVKKAMLDFYECKDEEKQIITLFSGVCKVNAALAAQILIDTFHVDCVISAGTCGGLAENIEVFDTIVATSCIYHDVEETILTEFHPWKESAGFESHPSLLEKCLSLELSDPLHFGTIATGEFFLDSIEQRRCLIEKYPGVLGIDMESCAIAHVCYVNAIPFLSVRTVTDNGKLSGNAAFEENVDKAAGISSDICMKLVQKL